MDTNTFETAQQLIAHMGYKNPVFENYRFFSINYEGENYPTKLRKNKNFKALTDLIRLDHLLEKQQELSGWHWVYKGKFTAQPLLWPACYQFYGVIIANLYRNPNN